MRFAAIDPGKKGAVAIFDELDVYELHDMPDGAPALASLLTRLEVSLAAIVVEDVNSGAVLSRQSAFTFGQGVGVIHGIAAALELPLHRVSPSVWTRDLGLRGKTKDDHRLRAAELHPQLGGRFAAKSADGRADAVLIGHWWVTRRAQAPRALP